MASGLGRGAFPRVDAQGGATADEAAAGTQGYIVPGPPGGRSFVLSGRAWPAASDVRSLGAGLNLVAYPRGVPQGSTAETLATTSGANHVIRSEAGPGGRLRLIPWLPPLSGNPWPLGPGRAYLIRLPAPRAVGFGR